MDVLRPPIIRVGGRCYRKYPVANNMEHQVEDTEMNSSTIAEDEEYYNEVCDAFANNIEETEHGFKVALHIPSNFFKYIIGKKGETKKRIENETRTQIKIPRQGAEGEIVIFGKDRNGLLSAKTRIDILTDSARQREPFTHFLSIPITSPAIREKFSEFKDDVCRFCSGDRGIDGTIFQNPNKLHLTIGIMVLLNESEISKAHHCLEECRTEILDPVLQGSALEARVRGLEYMNDDPCAVDVLYAKIELLNESDRLQILADQLVARFTTAGLMQQEYDRVKLHVTVMNTKMRKDPSGSSVAPPVERNTVSRGGKERESFDASQVLRLYGDLDFGTIDIRNVHISHRHSTDCDGYYKCEAKIDLP